MRSVLVVEPQKPIQRPLQRARRREVVPGVVSDNGKEFKASFVKSEAGSLGLSQSLLNF